MYTNLNIVSAAAFRSGAVYHIIIYFYKQIVINLFAGDVAGGKKT